MRVIPQEYTPFIYPDARPAGSDAIARKGWFASGRLWLAGFAAAAWLRADPELELEAAQTAAGRQ